MRLRQLQIRLSTTNGPYGVSIPFTEGLVVIWADNSMGKSTCARAILVALGMEAMLTTSQKDLPLTGAMTTKLDDDGEVHEVFESEVWLELQNSDNEVITVQRTVKGPRDKNIITVHRGAVLSENTECSSVDFFVNRAGGATRPAGFHSYLAEFLGWDLPLVQTYEGNEVPLYLQCILPYVMTEQTRGWSSVQPPVPSQFRIRDVHKRVVEFLLDMDAHRIALKRQALQLEKNRLEARWSSRVRTANALAKSAGGIAHGIPNEPTTTWPPQHRPSLKVPDNNTWIGIGDRLLLRVLKQQSLSKSEVPEVADAASIATSELAESEKLLIARQAVLSRLLEAVDAEEHEVTRVQQRLDALREDIAHNKDSRTLRRLGARTDSEVDQGSCPVCHQHIADALLPLSPDQQVMSLDQNIKFLEEQMRTFEAVLEQSKRVAAARALQADASRAEIGRLRERIRYLRETLSSRETSPSIASVYERVELSRDILEDEKLLRGFEDAMSSFEGLTREWDSLQKSLSKLPKEDLSASDHSKLKLWQESIHRQLERYDFKSVPWSEIELSPFSYKPEIEGFELQTAISASDLIRTIWAYQSGLLEVARECATNHPGLLIFDEPRQQSTRDVSFVALLKRASESSKFGQQVIFFTSEDEERLQRHLDGLPHTLHAIKGRVIQRVKRPAAQA